MTVLGIVALVKGQVKVIGKNQVRGIPAYVVGALMVATIPTVFAICFAVGFVHGITQIEPDRMVFAAIEFGIVATIMLSCIAISLVYAKEPPPPGGPPTGYPQFPFQDAGYPPQPSPPMDPNNPYAPPPGDWPPSQK